MVYLVNRPSRTENLQTWQPVLLGNFSQEDASFGKDHYAFSSISADIGLHNKVETPIHKGGDHPTTVDDPRNYNNPRFYGMQDSVHVNTLQYSRGPNDVKPTPITNLNSGSSPIGIEKKKSINILTFDDITKACGIIYVMNYQTNTGSVSNSSIFTSVFIYNLITTSGVQKSVFKFIDDSTDNETRYFNATANDKILQIENVGTKNLKGVYWSLNFINIFTA